ncbi:Uncharacterised protein [Achromobacter kerstersii]|nr:Uncharacterised protein [Achromobacter kerstersii]
MLWLPQFSVRHEAFALSLLLCLELLLGGHNPQFYCRVESFSRFIEQLTRSLSIGGA